MKKHTVGGYSVIVFNGSEYDQDDGWYYQVSEHAQADNVTYTEPNGPFPAQRDAGQAALSAIRSQEETMANEKSGFAISCPDGLWVTGFVVTSGGRRWILGLKEERTTYPTCTAAYLELDRMCRPDEEGYKVVELFTS